MTAQSRRPALSIRPRRRATACAALALTAAVLALSACEPQGLSTGPAVQARDVEAPEIFQVAEAGLWDGRPTTGGIWATHPDVREPIRVILRNHSNGLFAIGALFPAGQASSGPQLLLSAEASAAMDIRAGQPTFVDVVALRRVDPERSAPLVGDPIETVEVPLDDALETELPQEQSEQQSEDQTIGETEQGSEVETVAAAQSGPADVATQPSALALAKPFVQLGIFGVEANARKAASQMSAAGMTPQISTLSLNGKVFWRVIVGPAQSEADRNTLLRRVRQSGFGDAYIVSG